MKEKVVRLDESSIASRSYASLLIVRRDISLLGERTGIVVKKVLDQLNRTIKSVKWIHDRVI